MSRGSCGDPLGADREAVDPRVEDPADDEPLEGPASFALGLALGAPAGEVRLGRRIHPALGEHDLMEQHVQPAVPAAIEPVAGRSGARGFERRGGAERGELLVAEAGARPAELGHQAAGDKRTDALDLPQGGKPRPAGALELALQLAILAIEECELRGGGLNDRLALPGEGPAARGGVCPERRDARLRGVILGLADDEVREITSTSLRRLPLADFAWLVRTLAEEKVEPPPALARALGKGPHPSIFAGVVDHSPSVTLPLPKPGKAGRNSAWWVDLVERCRQAEKDHPDEPVKVLAKYYQRDRQTVRGWLRKARENGLLPKRKARTKGGRKT